MKSVGTAVGRVMGIGRVGDRFSKKVKLQLGDAKGKKVNGKIEIPEDWAMKPSKKKGGYRYRNPNNRHEEIRLMPGSKSNNHIPYMRIKNSKGYTDINGNIVNKKAPEGHIPIKSIK